MHHLWEIISELLQLPGWKSRKDSSIERVSQLDKQTRLFGRLMYAKVALTILAVLFCCVVM